MQRVSALRNSRSVVLLAVLLLLGVAAASLGRIIAPVCEARRGREPALPLRSAMAASGEGVVLALLGGFRSLAADLLWIRMHHGWERREIAGTDFLVRLVPAVDPRPLYFWLNGARILAYDVAAWRVHEAGGYEALARTVRERIEHEQARAAIAHLDAAIPIHGADPDFWVERANIALNRLQDFDVAAECYRRAWELPRGPYFAARLYGEVLRRAGRRVDALAWLRQLHPVLPRSDEAAADVVLKRIRELELELGVPASGAHPGG